MPKNIYYFNLEYNSYPFHIHIGYPISVDIHIRHYWQHQDTSTPLCAPSVTLVMLVLGLLVLLIGILASLFTSDVTILAPEQGGLLLGDPAYDIRKLKAPVVTGWKLRVLAYLLTQTRFSPSIRRFLLNDNNMHRLRELQAQIGPLHPPLSHPIRRIPQQQDHDDRSNNQTLYDKYIAEISIASSAYTNFPRRTIRYCQLFTSDGNLP